MIRQYYDITFIFENDILNELKTALLCNNDDDDDYYYEGEWEIQQGDKYALYFYKFDHLHNKLMFISGKKILDPNYKMLINDVNSLRFGDYIISYNEVY